MMTSFAARRNTDNPPCGDRGCKLRTATRACVMLGTLRIAPAATAIMPAIFWFRSAMTKAPPMTYRELGEFSDWLDQAARWSWWAAGLSGLSALLAGIVLLTSIGSG
jgi:hypothetical protein